MKKSKKAKAAGYIEYNESKILTLRYNIFDGVYQFVEENGMVLFEFDPEIENNLIDAILRLYNHEL